jgi:putative hydrolase of HD superfamily
VKNLENKTFEKIITNLPENLQKQYLQIWNEYQENNSKESNLVHQIDKLEMALQAEIYSNQDSSLKGISSFFDSANQEISDPNLLKLFKQLTNK